MTKTIDNSEGTTPMFIPCPACNNTDKSSFYKDIAPHMTPTYEWFRPTLKEVLEKRNSPSILEHYLKGGLDYRKIKTNLKIA
ncbi:hypothetical protein [Flavobacterium sp. N1994]|uniref:hypothetical protein n=1 Tax=Flavobacterium sp. N1994 TaxID=2986827 RepID=UPI00222336F8|nr:hypothetical protein [Flavobacterium sp. N1994]